MSSLTSLPAVRQVETDRPDLFAFDVVGQVSPSDVENFYGLLEAAYALHPSIDVLVRVIEHEGVEWGEMSPKTIEQGRLHAADHVRRCALVGEAKSYAGDRGILCAAGRGQACGGPRWTDAEAAPYSAAEGVRPRIDRSAKASAGADLGRDRGRS